MRQLAQAVRIYGDMSERRKPAELLPDPIVRYDDQPRFMPDATLWAWGRRGRPIAALKVELYTVAEGDNRRLYGLVSLSPGLITAEGEGWEWSARKPGVELQPLRDAPAPADSDQGRLVQMRQLARRFSGFQKEPEPSTRGRMELRLLPRPIHRYSDPESGLEDAAMFGLAFGTNPEVLLLIESRRQGESAATWCYGLARIGGAEVFVKLDAREVWKQSLAQPPTVRDTYMNRWIAPGEEYK
jgi:hypothetical protein